MYWVSICNFFQVLAAAAKWLEHDPSSRVGLADRYFGNLLINIFSENHSSTSGWLKESDLPTSRAEIFSPCSTDQDSSPWGTSWPPLRDSLLWGRAILTRWSTRGAWRWLWWGLEGSGPLASPTPSAIATPVERAGSGDFYPRYLMTQLLTMHHVLLVTTKIDLLWKMNWTGASYWVL